MDDDKPVVYDELYSLRKAIYLGNAQEAKEITEQVIQLGYSIDTILKEALFPPMRDIGDQLRDGRIFIPEVLMSARAMQGAMHALQPNMAQSHDASLGVVVIGTVAGDLHDIGKNLVVMILRAKGFSVIDLGIDVTAEAFVEAVKRYHPDILCISAMLTTTMPEMKQVIDLVTIEGLRPQVTIMVGGAPVNKNFAREIQADIYADTLFEAGEAAEDIAKRHISRFSV